jgi:hypothetical protein
MGDPGYWQKVQEDIEARVGVSNRLFGQVVCGSEPGIHCRVFGRVERGGLGR